MNIFSWEIYKGMPNPISEEYQQLDDDIKKKCSLSDYGFGKAFKFWEADPSKLRIPTFQFLKRSISIERSKYEAIAGFIFDQDGYFDYMSHKWPVTDASDEFYIVLEKIN